MTGTTEPKKGVLKFQARSKYILVLSALAPAFKVLKP